MIGHDHFRKNVNPELYKGMYDHSRHANQVSIKNQAQAEVTISQPQHKPDAKHNDKDPYTEYPLRGFAYSNEVGVALKDLNPVCGKLEKFFWVPALSYFALDISDKFKKGKEEGGTVKGLQYGIRQGIFHALSSAALPMLAIDIGKEAFEKGAKQLKKVIKNDSNPIKKKLLNNTPLVKTIGGFAALIVAAQPIDKFVEHYVIGKLINPLFGLKGEHESKK